MKKASTKSPMRLKYISFANGIDILLSDLSRQIGPAILSTKQLLEQAPSLISPIGCDRVAWMLWQERPGSELIRHDECTEQPATHGCFLKVF